MRWTAVQFIKPAQSRTGAIIIGATGESVLRLPFGLGVEADILYRHFSFGSSLSLIANYQTGKTTTGAWEFPLLAKYRFKGKVFRPYIDGGVAWDKLSGVTSTVQTIFNNVTTTSTTSNPFSLKEDTTRGFVLGGRCRYQSTADSHFAGNRLYALGRAALH